MNVLMLKTLVILTIWFLNHLGPYSHHCFPSAQTWGGIFNRKHINFTGLFVLAVIIDISEFRQQPFNNNCFCIHSLIVRILSVKQSSQFDSDDRRLEYKCLLT